MYFYNYLAYVAFGLETRQHHIGIYIYTYLSSLLLASARRETGSRGKQQVCIYPSSLLLASARRFGGSRGKQQAYKYIRRTHAS